MQKIRDAEGDVMAYEHNGYYLVKRYYYANKYNWVISKKITISKYHTNMRFNTDYVREELNKGYAIFVSSCREGKEWLKSL